MINGEFIIRIGPFSRAFSTFNHPAKLSATFSSIPCAFHRWGPSNTQLLYYTTKWGAAQLKHLLWRLSCLIEFANSHQQRLYLWLIIWPSRTVRFGPIFAPPSFCSLRLLPSHLFPIVSSFSHIFYQWLIPTFSNASESSWHSRWHCLEEECSNSMDLYNQLYANWFSKILDYPDSFWCCQWLVMYPN